MNNNTHYLSFQGTKAIEANNLYEFNKKSNFTVAAVVVRHDDGGPKQCPEQEKD